LPSASPLIFFLSGLSHTETRSYIAYRLEKAGGTLHIFTPEAIDMICQASGGIPRSINLLCDTALVYGFGYEFETIDATVIQQVIKDKGGMGLTAETDNKKGPFPLCAEPEVEKGDGVRVQKLEDSVQLLKMQVDFLAKEMEHLKEKTENFTKHMDRKLEKLLNFERKRSDKLMIAYTRLKVKYDALLKTRVGKD
jgi:general secretion pathway protein A